MNALLTKIKNEPVMTAAVVIAFVLAVLIQLGRLTVADLNEFVATFGTVLGVLLVFLGLRSKVTPVNKLP